MEATAARPYASRSRSRIVARPTTRKPSRSYDRPSHGGRGEQRGPWREGAQGRSRDSRAEPPAARRCCGADEVDAQRRPVVEGHGHGLSAPVVGAGHRLVQQAGPEHAGQARCLEPGGECPLCSSELGRGAGDDHARIGRWQRRGVPSHQHRVPGLPVCRAAPQVHDDPSARTGPPVVDRRGGLGAVARQDREGEEARRRGRVRRHPAVPALERPAAGAGEHLLQGREVGGVQGRVVVAHGCTSRPRSPPVWSPPYGFAPPSDRTRPSARRRCPGSGALHAVPDPHETVRRAPHRRGLGRSDPPVARRGGPARWRSRPSPRRVR